jgi:hypothetical protein
MTFKHIEFYDSPVMIELARQAIQKGTVKPLSMDEILKNASDTQVDDCQPSGNLMLDVSRLAEGLRAKGYVKEAISLEAKLMEYKRAAKEFSSILDQAHPEGDVEMGDASSDLGDVETLESAHLKMEEILKKVPTGKQTKAESLLAKTVAILREAQTAPANEMESVLSGQVSEQDQKIAEINKKIAGSFPAIRDLLVTARSEISPDVWQFTETNVIGNDAMAKLYAAKVLENSIRPVQDYIKLLTLLTGGLTRPENMKGTVYQLLSGLDYNSLYARVNAINPTIAKTYCVGTLPSKWKMSYIEENPEQAGNPIFANNDVSVWNFDINKGIGWGDNGWGDFVWDKDKLIKTKHFNVMVDEIVQFFETTYNNVFGGNKLATATKLLQDDLNALLVGYDGAISFFGAPPVIDLQNRMAVSTLVMQQADNLRTYAGSAGKKLLDLWNIVSPTTQPKLLSTASTVATELINVIDFVNQQVAPNEQLLTDVNQAATMLAGTARGFLEAAKRDGETSANYKTFMDNATELYALSKIVSAGKGKLYGEIFNKIKGTFPEAKSYQDLVQTAQTWMEYCKQMTGIAPVPFALPAARASASVEYIVKNALTGPGGTAPAAHKPDGAAGIPVGKPGAKPQSQVTHDRRLQTIDGDEKAAVIKMQDLMGRIATHAKNPAIATVGKNGASGSDGAWLGFTSRGLVTIQGLIAEHEKKTGQSIGRLETRQMGGTPGAKAAADSNSAVLRKYLAAAWNDKAAGDSQEGTPAGLSPELQSLSAFYDWLISSGAAKEESTPATVKKDPSGREYETGGQTGIDGTKFWMELGEMINWFKTEASPRRPDIEKHLQGLYQQLVGITNRYGLSPDSPRGNLVTKDMLAAPVAGKPGSGGAAGQPGQGGGPGGSAYVGRGQGGRGVSDGSDLEISDVENYPDPIYLRGSSKGDIDLNLEYYSELRQQFPAIPGYLNFRVFNSTDARNMAVGLFSDGQPLSKSNNYFQTMDMFLNALVKGITAAAKSWEDLAGPTPAERSEMTKHMMRWQRAIQQKKQQLKTSIV